MRRVRLALAVAPLTAVFVIGCSPSRVVEAPASKPFVFHALQRQSEGGRAPRLAMVRALRQREALLEAQGSAECGVDWHWEGPGNVGGRIRSILIHPKDSKTMWVGSVGGGIWKTRTGGASWFPLDDFLPSLSVGCMAMDPLDPDVLYAGTGEGFAAVVDAEGAAFNPGAGVFRSLDGGATWEQLASTAVPGWDYVNRIAICPRNRQLLLVGTSSGIYRSTNAGGSFTEVYEGRTLDVRFHPSVSRRAIAGLADGQSVFTEDGGKTWSASVGLSGTRVELAYAKSDTETVYAAVSQGDRVLGYRSSDGGKAFSALANFPYVETYDNYNLCLWVDPTDAETVIVGGVWPYRTRDGGQTWTRVFDGIHTDMHVFVEHPRFNGGVNRKGYVATDGGIYYVQDAYGEGIADLNNGLGITQSVGAAYNPVSGILVSGAMDNGTSLTNGGSATWRIWALPGDGAYCAASQTDGRYLFGEYQFANIFRSSNSGDSFFENVSPPYAGDRELFNVATPMMLDPNDENRMLVGGRVLWRCNNIKSASPEWEPVTWEIVNPSNNPQTEFDERNISAIAIAKGDSDIVWAGYNGGQVWMTRNGMAMSPSWQRVDGGNLPNRFVSKIVVSETDHRRVYVTLMGWEPNNLWVTDDAGASWRAIRGEEPFALPNVSVSSLAVHPLHTKWLYAGTDIGLFTSTDGGLSWTTSSSGPATVPVSDMFWKADGELVLVTYGRGVFTGTP